MWFTEEGAKIEKTKNLYSVKNWWKIIKIGTKKSDETIENGFNRLSNDCGAIANDLMLYGWLHQNRSICERH